MKKSALHKNSWREIRHSLARFLSILGIIFLGVAFFSGIKATGPDMLDAANRYYQKMNYHDLSFVSTMGLTNEDLTLLEKAENIQSLEGFHQQDVKVKDENIVVRLFDYDKNHQLDNFQLIKGRFPLHENEILLDNQQRRLLNYALGDELTFADSSLKNQTFKIVGFVESPLYIEHLSRGNTNVGKGSLDFFGFIPTENFSKDYFEGIRLTFKNAPKETYSKEYDNFIAKEKKNLEKQLANQPEKRLEEVKKESLLKLEDAKKQLAEGKEKLATGKSELEKAANEIAEGKEALLKGQADLTAALETGKAQLAANEEKLTAGKNQLAQAKRQLEINEKALSEKEQQLLQEEKKVNEQLALWPNYEAQSQEGITKLTQLQNLFNQQKESFEQIKEIEDPENDVTSLKNFLTQFLGQLEKMENNGHLNAMGPLIMSTKEFLNDPSNEILLTTFETNFKNLQEEIKTTIQQTQEEIATGYAKLQAGQRAIDNGKKELQEGKAALASGQQTLNEQEQMLTDSQKQLEEGKAALKTQEEQGQQTLQEKEAELLAGEKEYQKNLEIFNKEEAESKDSLANGEKELAEQEEKIQELKAPSYLYFTRKDQVGFSEYGENAQRITNIATVFPVIFFLIAALVSFTTMARMVEEKRGELGILKALGYKNTEISHKFILYAGLSGVLGSIGGVIAGNFLFPKLIFDAYGSLYNLSGLKVTWYPLDIVIAFSVALICTLGSALIALTMDLKNTPATLLRPKAPKAGKRILLERISFLWKKLSFTHKVTARNLFRYKARGSMTIIGIAGCMALMLTGFGLKDSVGDISHLQFNKLWHYQAIATFDEDQTPEEKDDYQKKMATFKDLKDQMPIEIKVLEKESGEVTRQNVTIYTPKDPQDIRKFVLFQNRKDKTPYSLTDDGGIVSEKFAKLFHLKVGSTFTVQDSDQKQYTIKVAAIAENYAMHFIYLSLTYYEKVFAEKPTFNSELLIFKEMNKKAEEKITEEMMSLPGVLNVSFMSETSRMMDDAMSSLTIVIWVLIVSAAMLAFIVLYNLTNINISERIRELSTIKVLGFFDQEVTMYIYRENLVLTVMGILLGSGLGAVLHQYVLKTVEVDQIMFGPLIHWPSYLYASLLTILFTLLVMIFMHYKLTKVDMIEALKSNE